MEPIYQPNDVTLLDKRNRYWRTKANYDELEQLFFELQGLDLTKVLADYMQGWQSQAARGFRQRERDRGDNKYPWVSIDPKNDLNRYSHASLIPVRHINFVATRPTGPQPVFFDCVGRLVRRYCLQHRPRRFAKLSLPIPIPAERDRQVMERFWQKTRESWLAKYEEGKKEAPNERLYLAEKLLHSSRIVISGARLPDILSYKNGHFSYPHDVGQLLGSIDYFKLCWREFHEAEQQPFSTKQAIITTDSSVAIASDEVLLIGKYYPELGKNSAVATLSTLAAEWYSDLAVSGIRRIKYVTVKPYEDATNKSEFLNCMAMLLTEAEKYSHIRGYGWRQHFDLDDLTSSHEARLEASGNETLRAVRHWHTEVSLSPVERFVHRARKIELWQNEQHQLTTLGLDYDDWRDVYAPFFLEFQRAIYHTDDRLLKAAYTELNLLLPTLHTRWLPRTDEYTGEESSPNNYFYASQLTDYWAYCEFVPLRPTSTTHSQRDPCLFAWLISHISIKQQYVWDALKLLAGRLDEPAPKTPYELLPPVPKPADVRQDYISPLAALPIVSPTLDNQATPATDTPASEWIGLLCQPMTFGMVELCAAFKMVGLLNNSGKPTSWGLSAKGAWAGAIDELTAPPALLSVNARAVRRCLAHWGVVLTENTLRNNTSAEAENTRKAMKQALGRK